MVVNLVVLLWKSKSNCFSSHATSNHEALRSDWRSDCDNERLAKTFAVEECAWNEITWSGEDLSTIVRLIEAGLKCRTLNVESNIIS